MLRISILALALVVTSAQAEEKTYSIQLTDRDLNVVGAALQAGPYRDVATVIAKIQQQITDQEKKKQEQPAAQPSSP